MLIDTGLLVERARGAGSLLLEELPSDEVRAISVITVSELLHGIHRAAGARRARRRAFPGFDSIPITEPVARVHAEVWADLAGRGETIGAHHLWIAAIALTDGLGVLFRSIVPGDSGSASRRRARCPS